MKFIFQFLISLESSARRCATIPTNRVTPLGETEHDTIIVRYFYCDSMIYSNLSFYQKFCSLHVPERYSVM